MNVLAFDLGGTRLKAGLVADGVVQAVRTTDAPARIDAASLCVLLEDAAVELLDGPPDGVGVCVPGLVDAGVVVSLQGKLQGLEGLDVGALARQTFGAPAVVVNDAVAYALGESVAGAGAGSSRCVVMTIGTGIGVTVIEDGAPATSGPLGAGILGGFIPISERKAGPVDSIGRHDTIEALCRADRIGGRHFLDPASTYDAFRDGDANAQEAIEAYRSNLVRAVAALALAHAPDRIILGGGPMTRGNPIVPGIDEDVNARLYGSHRVDVRIAVLGDAAALVGLAHLVENRS